MAPTQYEFEQPIGGKKIAWRPLKTGQELQIQATYRDAVNAHLKPYARLAARVVAVDGQPRNQNGSLAFSHADFGDWDDVDTDAFSEHVAVEEAKRLAAFSKKSAGQTAADFDAIAERAMAAAAEYVSSIRALRSMAMQVSSLSGPLPPTS